MKNCLDFINYKYKENTVTFVGDAANIYQEEIQNLSNKFLLKLSLITIILSALR